MNEVKHLKVEWSRDYTPIRRFYAWVGFITIILSVLALLALAHAGNAFVEASLAL